MGNVQPENTSQNDVPVGEQPIRRDLNDPEATFEDLPFTPLLTEKQSKRANQTFKGMLLSVGFTIAVIIPLLLLNPANKEESFQHPVDLQAVASEVSGVADFKVFAPQVSGDEYANFARWKSNQIQDVSYWEFGLVMDETNFVYVRQSADANPTWIALVTDNAIPSDERVINGHNWEVRKKDQTVYMISNFKDSTLIISSDTGEEELMTVVQAAEAQGL